METVSRTGERELDGEGEADGVELGLDEVQDVAHGPVLVDLNCVGVVRERGGSISSYYMMGFVGWK